VKSVRDPAYLAFIRSLPCSVCPRDRTIEAAHVGHRGLSQKSSDRETVPLCSLHHKEQHRIGLKRFARDYNLDIPTMLRALNHRPRIFAGLYRSLYGVERFYFAEYRDECFTLLPISVGLTESVKLAKQLCREHLIDTVFMNRVFR
jgi:hypothetical protein